MALQKNVNGFYEDDKPGEYQANFSITGEINVTIKASSIDEAKEKAQAMAEDEEFGIELDEVSDVSVGFVWKTKPVFLVSRGGRVMRVSHVTGEDVPREPDERGF